jgi:hypothetical protein
MAAEDIRQWQLSCDSLLPGVNDLRLGRHRRNLGDMLRFNRVTQHNPHGECF